MAQLSVQEVILSVIKLQGADDLLRAIAQANTSELLIIMIMKEPYNISDVSLDI